jgi:hypothetical protein
MNFRISFWDFLGSEEGTQAIAWAHPLGLTEKWKPLKLGVKAAKGPDWTQSNKNSIMNACPNQGAQ